MIQANIFIPTTNRTKSLNKCLQSLNNQSNKSFAMTLIGIEKNTSTEQMIKKFTDLTIDYGIQKKPGLVGAANEALQKSEHKIFIRIDDDVIVDKNWFNSILLTFKKGSRVGAVTGPTLLTNKGMLSRDVTSFLEKFRQSKNPLYRLVFRIYDDYIYEKNMLDVGRFFRSGAFSIGANFKKCLQLKPHEVENLEACNFACQTTLLKQLNGFDRTFEKGLGEYHEADLAFKIKGLGYKIIFNPEVKLWHHVENTFVKTRPDSLNRLRNFIIFYKRHIGFRNLDYFLRFSAHLFGQISYHIYKSLES